VRNGVQQPHDLGAAIAQTLAIVVGAEIHDSHRQYRGLLSRGSSPRAVFGHAASPRQRSGSCSGDVRESGLRRLSPRNEPGRPRFYELLRGTRTPCYVAFDLLWLNGTDLRALPLTERRKSLQGIVSKGSPIVSEALFVEGRGRELFELMCANDLEGIVVKRLADPYSGRVRWLNIKNPDYSQKEGRGDLFNGPRQRTARTAG